MVTLILNLDRAIFGMCKMSGGGHEPVLLGAGWAEACLPAAGC